MNELANKTALVADGGLFFELALRLARDGGFGRVLYYNTIHAPFPRINEYVIGDGFADQGVERIDSFWDNAKQSDVIVFPDCELPDWQEELRDQGRAVWGSFEACNLEWNRREFLGKLSELGLATPSYTVCQGLDGLRAELATRRDCYVKVSKVRGSMETWHHQDPADTNAKLNELAVDLGPAADAMHFIVVDAIHASAEIGYDGYFAGGSFPAHSMMGVEAKDKSYLGWVVPATQLPSSLRQVNEAFAPLLREVGYANFWSAEVRLGQDGSAYFLDPTCRHASPAGEPQLEVYGNLPEIIWAGAHGEAVDPQIDEQTQFAAQALISHDGNEERWRTLMVPQNVRRFVKLYSPVGVGEETYAFPPMQHSCESVGSVLGLGKTAEDALKALRENIEELEGQPVHVQIESLAEALREVRNAQEEGLPEVPEPALAVQA